MILDNEGTETIFSENFCAKCNLSFEELAPRIFSFNSPYGACERCSGLGADNVVDPHLVVPDRKKSWLTVPFTLGQNQQQRTMKI